jgi:hypothetical protein
VSKAEWEVFFFNVLLTTLVDAHQLLVYADEDNTLGVSVQTVKRDTEALAVANKEIGLKGNAEKIKYMVMS